VAASVKVTDNGVAAKLGDGLFKTGTMVLNDHRLDFADPVEGNVATQVVINEGMTGVIYQARLKVVKHEITEIETMTVHRQGAANGFFNIDNMKPEKVFLQEIPADKRLTRDKLKEITELYLDYLEGKKRGPDVPFDMGCKRYENGQVTASGLSSFNGQSWSFQVTRRILVIDEEAGITWGMFPFFPSESTLVVGEAFKIIDGKIMMIQAVMANQPAKAWD
jgi:phosphoribosylformylglycinamidine (FGAM) synthase PurS component